MVGFIKTNVVTLAVVLVRVLNMYFMSGILDRIGVPDEPSLSCVLSSHPIRSCLHYVALIIDSYLLVDVGAGAFAAECL